MSDQVVNKDAFGSKEVTKNKEASGRKDVTIIGDETNKAEASTDVQTSRN